MTAAEQIEYLYGIIHSYTIFFLVFDLVFFVAVVGGILLLINFLKSRHRLRTSGSYIRYSILGQEEERARIARELHDTVAQDLRYCRSLSEKIPDPELKHELSAILDKSISEVRSMSYNLAPPDITRNDLHSNLINLCNSFNEFCDIELRLTVPDGFRSDFLNEEENLNLYRIVQESLNNIVKHSGAEEATILLRNEIGTEEKGLYIFISDDGIGFDSSKNYASGSSHFGLVGMRERAQLIGATLSLDSELGDGTQVTVFKPETPS